MLQAEAADGDAQPRGARRMTESKKAKKSNPPATPADLSDGELAVAVAGGDRDAAEVLVLRYQNLVRSFLLRITGRRDLADDLAQDTFVRMLRYADNYDPKYPMRTWLLTIARRLSINHARNDRTPAAGNLFDGMHDSSDGPDAAAEAADEAAYRKRMLNEAMLKLTEPQREAVNLFYQQDQTVQQIAEMMEIPEGTVKSHLHRARAALKNILAPRMGVTES